MLSLPRKGPHCLAPIYSDLLMVKAIFSLVQDLLRGILEVKPSYHMVWPSLMMTATAILFSLIRFNYSYLTFTHSTSSSSESINNLNEGISTFKGITASIPYTNIYGVAPIEVRTLVQYA